MSDSTKHELKWAGGYVARPRRHRQRDGVLEHYWTVRCRRSGDQGEWSLGWFPSKRKAERAFQRWARERLVEVNRPTDSTAEMVAVIEEYCSAVPEMSSKRPSTVWNRQYTARKLAEFVGEEHEGLTIGSFDDKVFASYLAWLTKERTIRGTRRTYSPQSVQNFLRGARVFLRWAETAGFVRIPPKEPKYEVPTRKHRRLYAEEVEATIEHAPPPLALMLRLMWETGLRYAEAATLRGVDIDLERGEIDIRERGAFKPKTTKSARTVAVDDELLQALEDQVPEDRWARLFPCPYEAHYPYWRYRFYKAQRAAGIKKFTFHDLRRAFAEGLRRSGADVDVYIAIMGHSEITGMRHYSTVTNDDQRKAQERAKAFLRDRRPRSRVTTAEREQREALDELTAEAQELDLGY